MSFYGTKVGNGMHHVTMHYAYVFFQCHQIEKRSLATVVEVGRKTTYKEKVQTTSWSSRTLIMTLCIMYFQQVQFSQATREGEESKVCEEYVVTIFI